MHRMISVWSHLSLMWKLLRQLLFSYFKYHGLSEVNRTFNLKYKSHVELPPLTEAKYFLIKFSEPETEYKILSGNRFFESNVKNMATRPLMCLDDSILVRVFGPGCLIYTKVYNSIYLFLEYQLHKNIIGVHNKIFNYFISMRIYWIFILDN